ncbi:hypothetical protein Tco_1093443 [Tanacetum coccineum]|uniref:Retrotransposon gag domain-containing protein n=1 Tax=Tanacetum coccineum TaxID=301880 RepID=A0ABQ5ICR6_9ASTR
MEEINNFQQEPDENLYHAWERFKELLMKCPQHYLMEMQEVILVYNGLGIPTRQILGSRGAIPSKTAADAKLAIQDMAEYSQKWHNGTSRSRTVVDLGASVSVMPLSTYLNLGLGKLAHTKLTVKLANRTLKYPKGIAQNVQNTLRIREERIIFKSVKPASSLIKRVYMLHLRERMKLDLEARLMGDSLVINRSLDPLNGDYIELNDLNEPFKLRRNQGDDLIPTIKEVLENMDAYRDEGMGDVIFGEPFLREVGIETRRFEGMITIYNGNVSVEDKNNGISHPYQKLKGFYKGVLNLGPDYILDAKTEEWLTRGHIKVLPGRQPGMLFNFIESIFPDINTATSMKEISTNIAGNTNMEILKCWSLETSKRLFNTNSYSINSTWRIYGANIRGVSHSNSF